MKCVRTVALFAACLSLASSAVLAGPPKARPKPQPRKCPADKITIGGHDIAEILKMLGAKRDIGVSDEQVRSYASHFDRSDPNRDGKQTRAEYVDGGTFMTPQARAGIFGATDNNADGVATRAEYVLNRIITDEAKEIVQRTDADKNGKVTRNEFVEGSPIKDKALAGAVYDALDTNGDAVITIPEYLRVWGKWARPNYKAQEAALNARLAKLLKGGKPSGKPSGKPGAKGGKPSGGPPSVDQIFKIMDRNKDGKLAKDEFRGPPNIFTSADKNKDGIVTRKELEALRGGGGGKKPGGKGPDISPEFLKKIHKRIDANGDGKVTPDEFASRSMHRSDPNEAAAMFKRVDANSDGKITADEYVAFRSKAPKGGGKKPAGPKPPAGANAGIEAIFKRADTDGDGRLSRAEMRRLVKAGDTDGDDALSLKELIDLQRKTGKQKPKR